MPRPLIIATRKSPLALWQAEHVARRLRALDPALEVRLLPLSTRGDRWLDRPLASLGGKGLFLKELEVALGEGRADLAVHSLKDVPMTLDAGFRLAALLPREDPRDALVSLDYPSLAALPPGARVGSSSLRRQVQLRALRPDLELIDLRGNVNSRLAKLERGEYHAIVLAAVGLQRLGLTAHLRQHFAAHELLPAAGQGVLAIETRAEDAALGELLARLHCPSTALVVRAERAATRALGGSCAKPIAAHATRADGRLELHVLLGDDAARRAVRVCGHGPADQPELLGTRVAGLLLARAAAAEWATQPSSFPRAAQEAPV